MVIQIKERPKVLQTKEVRNLPQKPLPKSMEEAAGILKRNYVDLKRHYQKIRDEWPSYA
jgi:hypothetical protein